MAQPSRSKKRSKSSARWLQEHESDTYVHRSRQEGYRSRASYKLIEICDRDRLITPGMTVIDLGAAPGGWSQVAAQRVGSKGRVIASDILPMDALAGVEFVLGDFMEEATVAQIQGLLGEERAGLVISDMAPNMSGMKGVDQPKAMYLVELAEEMVRQTLRQGGDFLCKVFQGEDFDALLLRLRRDFVKVQSRKPDASRTRSREMYVLCRGYRGTAVGRE